MNQLAARLQIQPSLLWSVLAMFFVLMLGTIIRQIWLWFAPTSHKRDHLSSLATWWVLVTLFGASVLLGSLAVAALFATASLLGLWEFLRLTQSESRTHVTQRWAYAILPLNYVWIVLGWYEAYWITVPLACCLLIATRAILSGKTTGFLLEVTTISWGVLLIVYCLSHGAMLVQLPTSTNPIAGPAGWLVYLVLLTETNDIAQALWGRQFGRHKLTPRISPNKTWEGFLLGISTTVLLAIVLAPLLTPLSTGPTRFTLGWDLAIPGLWSALAGLLIGLGGVCGDLTISAVKRDVGVKDSSHLLPGQGGVLDRVDSLTFTAPLFFYYVYALYA